MNEDEAQRLRHKIQADQTSCRCGHLLAACADCREWLIENSPRMACAWRWYLQHVVGTGYVPASTINADAAELDDRACFGL